MKPHYLLTTTCVYCGAPADQRGEPCPARAEAEAPYLRAHGPPYDPVRDLGGRVFDLAWNEPGWRLEEGTGADMWTLALRVWRGDELVAEGVEVTKERAAVACLVALRAAGVHGGLDSDEAVGVGAAGEAVLGHDQ